MMKLTVPVVFACASVTFGCGSTAKTDTAQSSQNAADSGTNPCGLHTKYAGDDLCIPPPDPAEGIQIHVGPTSYDDPDALAPYLLAAGQETVDCFNAAIPDSDFYYLRQKNRMRPNSHHMLIFVENKPGLTEGPAPTGCDISDSVASIPGSQTTSRDFPDKMGPEDQGLGRYLPAATMAGFQLHYINTTTGTVLREAWVNLYKADPASITQHLQSIFMVGDIGVDVPAHTEQTTNIQFQPTLPGETRVFEMNAHMHAHAQSMSVWLEHGGQESLIYKSFNWEDPYENTFNSVVKNPLPDPKSNRDGGISGLFYLEPGDSLRWACDVNNTTNNALRFANEALTAEMCMLVGSYIAPTGGALAGICANGGCSANLFSGK